MDILFPTLAAAGYGLHFIAAIIEYDLRAKPKTDRQTDQSRSCLALRCVMVGCVSGASAYVGEMIHWFLA